MHSCMKPAWQGGHATSASQPNGRLTSHSMLEIKQHAHPCLLRVGTATRVRPCRHLHTRLRRAQLTAKRQAAASRASCCALASAPSLRHSVA